MRKTYGVKRIEGGKNLGAQLRNLKKQCCKINVLSCINFFM